MSDIRERLARTSCRIDCQNAASGGFCADSCRLHPESVLMVRELSRIDAILSDLDAQGLVIVPREPTSEMRNAGHRAIRDTGASAAAYKVNPCWQAMLKAAEQ